ncbi:hypothetical protein [Arthrobacter sp. ISL-72]|uniref:hypothetical protein n=1 Tax=Arthrobacter sp. ISL-72 TaxID=2819114 RepID=UPI001BEA0217|nr:hypothetical protein [Arthrobacter sp. ISL-72]MBT2597663.1 hypothetical protein [Arthrobacter sp. ISL-72]
MESRAAVEAMEGIESSIAALVIVSAARPARWPRPVFQRARIPPAGIRRVLIRFGIRPMRSWTA